MNKFNKPKRIESKKEKRKRKRVKKFLATIMTTMARNEYYMTEKLKVLDLFSGLGGFSLGLERTGHFETVAFCDNDKYSKLIIDKHWKGKRYTKMSEKSQKKNSLQTELNFPMSSQEDSRANRSRSRANKKERVTTDISGQRCFALSRHSNRGSWLARTCEELLTSKTAWSSKLCALTWKMKDTKSKRSIFQLRVSALPTEEKEFGSSQLWATPNTMDDLPTRSERRNREEKRQNNSFEFEEQVDEKTMQLWRTPTTMDSKEDSLKHATKLLQGKT